MRHTTSLTATAAAIVLTAGAAFAATTAAPVAPDSVDGSEAAARSDSPAESGTPARADTADRSSFHAHERPARSRDGHGAGHHAHEVSSELDFLVNMIPHHEEAVVAAEQLRDGTDRPEMEEFSDLIIEVQTDEIEQMRAWLADWYPDHDRQADYEPMMRDLDGLEPDEVDRIFLEDMIRHHMGAVMMSMQLLGGDLIVNDDIVPFARQIADDQRAEIMQMRRWLADWYDTSPMGGLGHGLGGMRGGEGMHHGGGMRGGEGLHHGGGAPHGDATHGHGGGMHRGSGDTSERGGDGPERRGGR